MTKNKTSRETNLKGQRSFLPNPERRISADTERESACGFLHFETIDCVDWVNLRDDDGMEFSLDWIKPFAGKFVKISVQKLPEAASSGGSEPLVYKLMGITVKNYTKERKRMHARLNPKPKR